jgi:SAM-dependent methyltransferase
MARSLSTLRRSLARRLDPQPPAPEAGAVDLRTEIVRRYLTGLGVLRTELARRYIRGAGIEFGALDFPLAVPPGTAVQDADFQPAESVKQLFSVPGNVQSPHLVTDLESMHGVLSASQDFVIANHVLEHVEDPLKALHSVSRVLRTGGIAYLALPDKRFTFDKEREVTSLAHLLRDHAEGPDWSLAGHYEEWIRVVDGLTGEAHAQKLEVMLKERSNIHFHVWDFAAMMELFAHVERDRSFALDVENATLNSVEVVWILRKR